VAGEGLTCVECGATADARAMGWRAYLIDWRACLTGLGNEDEPFEVAVFCPACAALESG
jgi:hypothetical protein